MQIFGQIHDRSFPIHIDTGSLTQIPQLIPELQAPSES